MSIDSASDETQKSEDFLKLCESPEELRNWIFTYLDIDLPLGHVDPDSNSSPAEWLYEAYATIRDNGGDVIPAYIILSSRDSYKTLTASILEVLAIVHFKLTVSHMAAIKPQSAKAIQYINNFFRKIKTYMEHHKLKFTAENKSNIQVSDENGDIAYIVVIVCTLQGANSEHTNIMIVDEIDVVQYPNAYEEAKAIPGVFNGRFPLTIKTSTRKFAYGLMQKEIDAVKVSGDVLLRWNIIDVTENCPKSRHKPELKKEIRYIPKSLPLKNLSKKEFNVLQEEEKIKFNSIKAYKGCASCPLLAVCKMRLAERPEHDFAGLYKPIAATINLFKKFSPDMATAQLMCWKPSSSGLVYPRFDQGVDTGNALSLLEAYESISGEKRVQIDLPYLIEYLKTLGIKFYTGVDWGYRHYYAIVVGAKLPNGEFWIVDSYAISELEYDDQLSLAKTVRDLYKPEKWYCDPAYPMMIKGFSNNGMKCPGFTKDVMGGIESTRAQIVDAQDKRRMRILDTDNNQFLLDMFKNHHFKSDAQGRITTHPDDEEYADIADALRYMCQELFPLRKNTEKGSKNATETNVSTGHSLNKENWMRNEIKQSIKENGGNPEDVDVNNIQKKKGVMWIP